jgi:asparagine synthase (glutamine-hydrolysing)
MIIGSFSLNTDSSLAADKISKAIDCEGLYFHQVASHGFTGGYYLHINLPLEPADFCYYDELNDLMVLMSGSIYNRSEVLHLSNKEDGASCPELVAGLFLREGPDFVKRLNGDFAIFILQPAKKQTYLFRDQAGIRPVGYTINPQTLFFSSDINRLCGAVSGGHDIDREYLLGYFKYIDYRITPDKKVARLLPGHYLEFSESGFRIKKYWEPEKIRTDRALSYERIMSDLRSILHDAVKMRCDQRFTAGAHVSSGIDSGIVSALARKEYPQQKTFYGFSWSPADFSHPNLKYDERELVRTLCLNADISPVFSDIDRGDFPEMVSSFYDNHGFFSEDRTIRQAVDIKTNLIFSGWGGDEFISTAAPAIEPDLLRSLKLGLYLRRNQIRQPKKFVMNVVYYVLMPALGILDRSTSMAFRDDARYLKKSFKKSDRKAIRRFYFHTSRRRHHLGMLNFYHLQDRCEKWYVMGYRKGVEYRYPLLDKRILEYMLKVPSELLCTTEYSRPLLREISEGILPEEIRMNMSKNDPVYWAWMDELYRGAGIQFMNEVDVWERNPDLHFVDFAMLNEDIRKYKNHSPDDDYKVLFRTLIYLKAIHEFTLAYRK